MSKKLRVTAQDIGEETEWSKNNSERQESFDNLKKSFTKDLSACFKKVNELVDMAESTTLGIGSESTTYKNNEITVKEYLKKLSMEIADAFDALGNPFDLEE
jgi:uncharacterized protein YeaO (DUF488 family)